MDIVSSRDFALVLLVWCPSCLLIGSVGADSFGGTWGSADTRDLYTVCQFPFIWRGMEIDVHFAVLWRHRRDHKQVRREGRQAGWQYRGCHMLEVCKEVDSGWTESWCDFWAFGRFDTIVETESTSATLLSDKRRDNNKDDERSNSYHLSKRRDCTVVVVDTRWVHTSQKFQNRRIGWIAKFDGVHV